MGVLFPGLEVVQPWFAILPFVPAATHLVLQELRVNPRRLALILIFISTALLSKPFLSTMSGDDWLPIDPADLKMTSEPKAPGAPAIYLYRQVDRDDQGGRESQYYRIKVFTEEGRKQADVEIPFLKGVEQVNSIKARTIRPDGSVANFDGKVYEKTIVKARGVKYLAKTFTLPDVQVGSIIEYKYIDSWSNELIYDSRWIISSDLFTKRAKFTLKPYTQFALRWSWRNLPAGSPQLSTNTPPSISTSTTSPPFRWKITCLRRTSSKPA